MYKKGGIPQGRCDDAQDGGFVSRWGKDLGIIIFRADTGICTLRQVNGYQYPERVISNKLGVIPRATRMDCVLKVLPWAG